MAIVHCDAKLDIHKKNRNLKFRVGKIFELHIARLSLQYFSAQIVPNIRKFKIPCLQVRFEAVLPKSYQKYDFLRDREHLLFSLFIFSL